MFNASAVNTWGAYTEPVALDWQTIYGGDLPVIRELLLINDRDSGGGVARFDDLRITDTLALPTSDGAPAFNAEFETLPTLTSWNDPRASMNPQDITPVIASGTGSSGSGLRMRGNTWKALALPASVGLTAKTYLRFDAKISVRGEVQGVGVQTASGQTFLAMIEENQQTNVRWLLPVNKRHQPLGTWQTFDIPIGRWWKYVHGAASVGATRIVFANDNDAASSLGDITFDRVSLYEKDELPPVEPPPAVSGPLFYVNDHLGTPLALNDSNGVTRWQAQRDPWGRRYNESTAVSGLVQPFELPGQYRDEETELSCNWNRYYDGGMGRYISEDPRVRRVVGFKQHAFAYAKNSPSRWTDSLGLEVQNNSSNTVFVKPEG